MALYAILEAAGIGEGDEVLVPGFTCVVVPAAIQYTGAKPVFYDIDPRTYNGDPVQAVAAITPRTKAVMIQHTFGMPMDPGELARVCRERGILVIEDAAHSQGATLAGRPVGTVGDAAFVSYQWSKPVTTGLGGAALVNDARVLGNLRQQYDRHYLEPSYLKSLSLAMLSGAYNRFYRSNLYWMSRDSYRFLASLGVVQGSSSDLELLDPAMPKNYCERFGRFRLGQMESALDRLPAVITHRRTIADYYNQRLQSRDFGLQEGPAEARSVWLRFPLLVDDRSSVISEARKQRIELGDWFNAPLHPSLANESAFGYEAGMCPVADDVSSRIVNLPTHTGVSLEVAEKVATFIERH